MLKASTNWRSIQLIESRNSRKGVAEKRNCVRHSFAGVNITQFSADSVQFAIDLI